MKVRPKLVMSQKFRRFGILHVSGKIWQYVENPHSVTNRVVSQSLSGFEIGVSDIFASAMIENDGNQITKFMMNHRHFELL